MKTGAILTMKIGLLALAAGCCTLNQPDDPCRRDEATVLIGPGQLHMKPECVSTVPGGTVTLHLKLAQGVNNVKTKTKESALWLNTAITTERREETVVIEVPEDACPGGNCEFRYEVIADGVGVLDPRVRVR